MSYVSKQLIYEEVKRDTLDIFWYKFKSTYLK